MTLQQKHSFFPNANYNNLDSIRVYEMASWDERFKDMDTHGTTISDSIFHDRSWPFLKLFSFGGVAFLQPVGLQWYYSQSSIS